MILSHACLPIPPHGQGDSSRTRTYDRLLRRQLLYPTELLSHELIILSWRYYVNLRLLLLLQWEPLLQVLLQSLLQELHQLAPDIR